MFEVEGRRFVGEFIRELNFFAIVNFWKFGLSKRLVLTEVRHKPWKIPVFTIGC